MCAGTKTTPNGQLVFFAEFLATAGVFDRWVEASPLEHSSPNAPDKRDVLGTLVLAILAGHKRYAHVTALRGDAVAAQALGMQRVISEDALRRAPSTISREIGRNGGQHGYRAALADQAAWERALRPKLCKLAKNRALARVVSDMLRMLWSPEQIAGWLKHTYPNDQNCRRSSTNRSPGTEAQRCMGTSDSRWPPTSRFTSATRKALGSGAATRTPTACSGSTCPRASTSLANRHTGRGVYLLVR